MKVELESFLQQMYELSSQPQMLYHNIFKDFMCLASKKLSNKYNTLFSWNEITFEIR